MGLTGQPQALFDVANCEAFVQKTIDNSRIRYGTQEREELLSEGLTILYELAGKYKPLPEPPCGYAKWFAMTLGDRQAYERNLRATTKIKRGSFSGHCSAFLPKRLGDAWHRSHPEHRYITDPETGVRAWQYDRPVLSLDAISDANRARDTQGAERHLLHARRIHDFCHATRAATVCLPG